MFVGTIWHLKSFILDWTLACRAFTHASSFVGLSIQTNTHWGPYSTLVRPNNIYRWWLNCILIVILSLIHYGNSNTTYWSFIIILVILNMVILMYKMNVLLMQSWCEMKSKKWMHCYETRHVIWLFSFCSRFF